MTTLRERFAAALIARGSEEVPSKSEKYLTFTRPAKPGTFYFIGVSGALRFGRTSGKSIAASDAFKSKLLATGDQR